MKVWLIHLWDTFRSSFWFVPALMALAAVAAAIGMPILDHSVDLGGTGRFHWLTTTADAAGATLSALVGAMITVVGLVFSITVVTLSLATSQFGSRLLRTMMGDRATQFSLGMFLAASVYCVLLLPRVYGVEESRFVPHLAVAMSVVAGVVNLVVLIYFIHHVATSIQAQSVVKAVGDDLDDAIHRLFPEQLGLPPNDVDLRAQIEQRLSELGAPDASVPSAHDGYVQGIDTQGLMELARRHDLVLQIAARPGHFIVRDEPLARVWRRGLPAGPRPSADQDGICAEIQEAWILGIRRTPRQDVECAIDELVEVAVRALSPGINDPFTAIACVDRLGGALCRLAAREIPSPLRYDREEHLRVVASPVTFPDALAAAFNQIRQYGRTSVSVTIRLLETLALVGSRAQRPGDRLAIRRQAEMIYTGADASLPEGGDRRDVEQRFEQVLQVIAPHPAATASEQEPAASDEPSDHYDDLAGGRVMPLSPPARTR